MSVQAIAWVLSETPELPPHLLGTLIGLANHAGEDGRGCYPSVATLARYAHKSERQVQRDLQELLGLGFIREGDQRFTAHLREDRRPVVYDILINGVTPMSPRSVNGVTSVSERGDMERSHGVTSTSPEPSTKPKANPARARVREEPHHVVDAAIDSIKKATGRTVSREWARTVADHVIGDRSVSNPAAYVQQAIESEPQARQRFLPTPLPPRVDRHAIAIARRGRVASEDKAELISAVRQKLKASVGPIRAPTSRSGQ